MQIRLGIQIGNGRLRTIGIGKRQNPVMKDLVDRSKEQWGTGDQWTPATYGEYYVKSVPIYAAIKLRADAVASVPLQVLRGEEEPVWVGRHHPAQAVLNRVNPFWTRGDLWRATETYLGLWGVAYWFLVRQGEVPVEIWPLRPDRMRIVPDTQKYIKGFVYGSSRWDMIAFKPEEIVWIRYFNPLDEFGGLSPIAPLRLSADMGMDALRANRSGLRNDSVPGLIFETQETPSEEEVKEFYERWESRYRGVDNARRPALLSAGMTAKNLGFSPRDMEYVQSMRWSLEDVSRAYNVPQGMLHDLEHATYANIRTQWMAFWLGCIGPELQFYTEELNEMFLRDPTQDRSRFGDDSLVVAFDTSKVKALQEAEGDKAARLSIYVKSGILTPNEARKEINFPPSDQEGADLLHFGPGLSLSTLTESQSLPGQSELSRPRSRKDIPDRAEALFDRVVKAREEDLHRFMASFFQRQVEDMLKRLRELRQAYPLRKDSVLYEDILGQRQPPGQIFNPEDWNDELSVEVRPRLERAMESAAEQQIGLFKLGISFDVTRPIPQKWLLDRAVFLATNTNLTTAQMVLEAVKKAHADGESIEQLAQRIKDIGEVNSRVRATLIARTENIAAANEGHLQAYEQAGIGKKQWWTAQDMRVRGNNLKDRFNHVDAQGQVRALNADFDVSGEKLRAPGQGGSPGNVVNCRCLTLPVFD